MTYFDDNEDRIIYGGRYRHHSEAPQQTQCKRCGSTDVRWRQQGGRWVLFSLKPGVEHRCDSGMSDNEFEEL